MRKVNLRTEIEKKISQNNTSEFFHSRHLQLHLKLSSLVIFTHATISTTLMVEISIFTRDGKKLYSWCNTMQHKTDLSFRIMNWWKENEKGINFPKKSINWPDVTKYRPDNPSNTGSRRRQRFPAEPDQLSCRQTESWTYSSPRWS